MSMSGMMVGKKEQDVVGVRKGPKKGLRKRQSQTQPSPHIPPKDREDKIDYTLDTVLNDLIEQGHLNPAKSYKFKTPEMKEHIGKMCDRVHRRKYGFPEQDPLPEVEPEPQLVQEIYSMSSMGLSSSPLFATAKKNSKKAAAAQQQFATPGQKKTEGPTRSSSKGSRQRKEQGQDQGQGQNDPIDHLLKQSPVQFPGGATHRLNERFDPINNKSFADIQAYRATVDLRGFNDEHISLELDDRRLIIIAQRPQNDKLKINARKVIEVIDIPQGINLTNLKIGRGSDGTVLVEEYSPS